MDKPTPIDPALVNEFVVAGHGDIDEVVAMLKKEPGLLNACWDWGQGDWETALGGASHIGRPDIANKLLEEGARADIFCAAMLGLTDWVLKTIELLPQALVSRGPHGITLVQHALAGGHDGLAEQLTEMGSPVE